MMLYDAIFEFKNQVNFDFNVVTVKLFIRYDSKKENYRFIIYIPQSFMVSQDTHTVFSLAAKYCIFGHYSHVNFQHI